MATIIDVANLANVSRQTVSRVINNSPNISPKTRETVLNAIKQLNYQPNEYARMLKTSKNKTIGYIISDPQNHFYISIANTLQHKLDEYGYSLTILFSNENVNHQDKCFEAMVQKYVKFILYTPTTTGDNIDEFSKKHDVKIIQLFRKINPYLPYIIADDEIATYNAVKTLIENSHEKFALVVGPYETENRRLSGLKKAIKDKGLEFNDSMYVKLNGSDEEQNKQLSEYIKNHKPTALIPVSTPIEYITLEVLFKLGLKIKSDISLIFYDDNELSKLFNITSVSHDIDVICEAITKALIEDKIENIKLTPYLAFRDSIKKLN